MTTAIWWIRRDLRLADNDALTAALTHSRRVIPVFILDPALLDGPTASDKRNAFLFAGLRALDADLRARGSRLIVRRGRPVEELARLTAEIGATAIYAEEDYSPYARRRDAGVAARLPLSLVGSSAIRPPGLVMKRDGSPYTVFSPFSRAWLGIGPLPPGELRPAPIRLSDPGAVDGLSIPGETTAASAGLYPAGEAAARQRLEQFLAERGAGYDEIRNRLDIDGTSHLSPYLRFGMVSARATAVAAQSAIAQSGETPPPNGISTWLNELIWRDFYIHILYHFPHVSRMSFREALRDVLWHNDPAEFDAWRHGQTGYPVIDAAMRQLDQVGWMPNRARMIVASFLVKDLLIDWRWGERWFMNQLIDGDPAANNGGWQWTAGTGTDAAPYFRIFNPVTQSRKFDPTGAYVRRWVPELAAIPAPAIHEPWRLKREEQQAFGCILGRDYPLPIVDHAAARQRTLAAYRAR
ncbi:MAG: deoxyribodipyrimidine photo-lyase [Candidatus Promineofilum sp.]|nr:deoxyribodipyrimidine photo-lyase [Promineifilum sp.]